MTILIPIIVVAVLALAIWTCKTIKLASDSPAAVPHPAYQEGQTDTTGGRFGPKASIEGAHRSTIADNDALLREMNR